MEGRQKGSYLFYIFVVLLSVLVTFVPEFSHEILLFELLVQGRPYIALLLLAWALFFAFRRYSLLFAVQILCVVASLFFVVEGYSGNRPSKACPDGAFLKSVRVLSFNVFYKNENYADIVQAVEGIDADIVLLQEVQSGLYHYGHARLSHKYAFHYSDLEQGIAHGKAIYSKYPIESVGKEKLMGSVHRVLHAKMNINGQLINFIGVHTYSPKNAVRIKDRNQHIQALKRYAVSLEAGGEPVIMAGDFNTTPWHPTMKHFKEQTQLNNNGFYNIIRTWPAWLPTFVTIPIDHIFYNSSFGHSNYHQGLPSGSDHYPIYVDLRICE